MDGPRRLLDGPGTVLERALLQELRSYHGSNDTRAHTLAALGLTGTTGLAAGGVWSWWSAKTWGTKLLLTASIASVLAGVPTGYFLLSRSATPLEQHALPIVTTKPPSKPMPSPAPYATQAVLDDRGVDTQAVPDDPGVSAVQPPAVRVPRRAVTGSADLRAELEALDSVRAAHGSRDCFRALSLLEAYFQNFHRGRLHLEAEILRIDALARCGQTDRARSYANEFLRLYPKSVHAARLQALKGP